MHRIRIGIACFVLCYSIVYAQEDDKITAISAVKGNVTANETDTVFLKCQVTLKDPTVNITAQWRMEDKVVEPDSRHVFNETKVDTKTKQKNITLTITSVEQTDMGTYKCFVTENGKNVTSTSKFATITLSRASTPGPTPKPEPTPNSGISSVKSSNFAVFKLIGMFTIVSYYMF